MMAIVERDMRKFFRSPALMMAAMVFPLVQLIVLGNAFGGKIHDAKLGIVAHDNGPQAIRVLEALRQLRERHGCAVVVVTHSSSVAGAADRVVEMRDGRVLA